MDMYGQEKPLEMWLLVGRGLQGRHGAELVWIILKLSRGCQ